MIGYTKNGADGGLYVLDTNSWEFLANYAPLKYRISSTSLVFIILGVVVVFLLVGFVYWRKRIRQHRVNRIILRNYLSNYGPGIAVAAGGVERVGGGGRDDYSRSRATSYLSERSYFISDDSSDSSRPYYDGGGDNFPGLFYQAEKESHTSLSRDDLESLDEFLNGVIIGSGDGR